MTVKELMKTVTRMRGEGWIDWPEDIEDSGKSIIIRCPFGEIERSYRDLKDMMSDYELIISKPADLWGNADVNLFLQFAFLNGMEYFLPYTEFEDVFKFTFRDLNSLYKEVLKECKWIKFHTFEDDKLDIVDEDEQDFRIDKYSLKMSFNKLQDFERKYLIEGMFYSGALDHWVRLACGKEEGEWT